MKICNSCSTGPSALAVDSMNVYTLGTATSETQPALLIYVPIGGGSATYVATRSNGYVDQTRQLIVNSQGAIFSQDNGDVQHGAVNFISFDGGSGAMLATTPEEMCWFDVQSSLTYVSYDTGGAPPSVFAQAGADGGVTPLFVADAGVINKFELVGGNAYVSAGGQGMYQVPLDGGPSTTLDTAGAFNLVTDASSLYWIDSSATTIYKMAIGSTVRSTVVSYGSGHALYGLAVDASYVYYGLLSNMSPQNGIYRIPK